MRGLLAVAVLVGAVGLSFAGPIKAPAKAAPKRAWMAAPMKPAAAPLAKDTGTSRTLQTQGMTAYKAGNYNAAVRKFAAAMDGTPSAELLYQSAQAYRMKGERAKALELYERYLEQAPDGSAAPVCRWYVERLRATP